MILSSIRRRHRRRSVKANAIEMKEVRKRICFLVSPLYYVYRFLTFLK